MAIVRLLFQLPALTDGAALALAFGEAYEPTDYELILEASVPLPGFSAVVSINYDATLEASVPLPTFSAELNFDLNVARPLVAEAAARHQDCLPNFESVEGAHQDGVAMHEGFTLEHRDGIFVDSEMRAVWQDGLRIDAELAADYQDGIFIDGQMRARWQDGTPVYDQATARHQDSLPPLTGEVNGRYADMLNFIGAWVDGSWQDGVRLVSMTDGRWGVALPLNLWHVVKYQDGIPPPAGIGQPTEPPVDEDPCYIPPPGDDVVLTFKDPAGTTRLLFFCERHPVEPPAGTIVVPVKKVYMVINTLDLRKVDGNVPITCYSMSLTLDSDSWTWGFRASVHDSAFADLQYVDGVPVELEATINGNAYRVLAEDIQRDRTFGRVQLTVSGRGKNAYLADRWSPILTFTNEFERTAQQLMDDALTLNGVPLGWNVDFQLEDWEVPAGVWSARGSYMQAITTIAAAAGGYVQPHDTDMTLLVLPRYPVAPWNWAAEVTPDFSIPADVATAETTGWVTKQEFNRVYLSGVTQGVLARITKEGADGSAVAPMVVDALMTDEIVARQRGTAILGNTGRQAMFTLRMPVLAETGIIKPGAFVDYYEGAVSRLGLVRSVGVEVQSLDSVWQTLTLETHE